MGLKTNRGRYITKVGYLDIRAIDTYKKEKSRGMFKKASVESTDLVIYHAKTVMERGNKNIETAIAKCKFLLGKEYCEIHNL